MGDYLIKFNNPKNIEENQFEENRKKIAEHFRKCTDEIKTFLDSVKIYAEHPYALSISIGADKEKAEAIRKELNAKNLGRLIDKDSVKITASGNKDGVDL